MIYTRYNHCVFAFLICGLAVLAVRILCKITIKYKMVLIYLYIVI